MPTFRKLTAEPSYAEVARAYDALLAGFVAGDYGRAEVDVGEQRAVVRAQLQAAAARRGFALRFRPGRGPMVFCVEQAAPSSSLAAAGLPSEPAPPKPPLAPKPPAARPTRRQRRPRDERRPAGRYDDVLPRWMREGDKKGRR